MAPRIFYVGTEKEVLHHARPLENDFKIELIEPEKVSAVATSKDLALFFSEHFRRFRSAITELKDKGCRTLYAIDGIIEWRNSFENRETEPACPWTMRPVLSNKVAAIGRSQARMLNFWGNRGKVELIGLPRLDALLSNDPTEKILKTPGSEDAVRERSPRILVMTAKWPAFTDQQQTYLEASLNCLKEWFGQHPEVDVVWRLTQDLDQKLGLENSMESCDQKELVDLLAECDALITTPSTAMLEGMLLQKPTAILEFNDCPQFNSVAWQIRSAEQCDSVIKQLLEPSPFKMAQQDFALHDTLECATAASPRLRRLIETMLESPADEASGEMVPIENDERYSHLGSDFLYNGYHLAETNDVDVLKAQLAFMEREYQILSARNELIEREFERAKSTIHNVFNNPVVFPFIKAGELAGKLFTKPAATSSNE